MLDPILYTFDFGSFQIPIRWYGLLVVAGALAGAWYAAWYFKRKGEDPNIIWDALIWLLISGIVGARIWYVVSDIIGGGQRYLTDPLSIVYINQGGLNILGGVMLAAIVGWYYAQRNKIDFWLLTDAVGPGALLGQAIGRLGNYINQELYGPPTTLPWGIPIEAAHRLAPWNDMTQYPFETTRFHPTFAYEMIWNLLFVGLLTWMIVRYGDRLKTGIIAASALIVAGVGRTWIELFRPDQPRFFETAVSTSMVISIIFALIGVFILLVKLGKINVPFMKAGSADYARRPVRRPPRERMRRQER
ncbi:MAG: prolipoprotein diacylglyceryl transferase [Anaerolineales bacterium]|nr:prolipoprotein diacylglyceryl transferase [Anaerolineales bacterium]